jgi:hypothetical protein
MKRRDFLALAGAAIAQHAVASILPTSVPAVRDRASRHPDVRLRMHCHQQLHMDFGFMHLIRYAG